MTTMKHLVTGLCSMAIVSGAFATHEVKSLQDWRVLVSSSKPVFLMVYAKHNKDCKDVARVVTRAESKYGDKIIFAQVDFSKARDVLTNFVDEGNLLPVLVFFKNGTDIKKHVGQILESELKHELKKMLV